MKISDQWQAYQILDCGDKEKLESWDGIILRRPDPCAIWPKKIPDLWHKCDGYYHRNNKGGGYWEFNQKLSDYWVINYKKLKFKISLTNFKHTGLFPEQAYNWDLIDELVSKRKNIRVLNLFGYTGAATIAASKAGAIEVVHVDASKGMIAWAKENVLINDLKDNLIRFIEEDCSKFMQREIRRKRQYDLIIMDPPSYGRGPKNELFKFEDQINELLSLARQLLSDKPIGIILNSYTTGYGPRVLYNLIQHHTQGLKGVISSDELCLNSNGQYLPCGLTTSFICHD